MACSGGTLYPRERHARPVTSGHARTSARAADGVIATIRPAPQVLRNAASWPADLLVGVRSGAASGHQYQRDLQVGLDMSTAIGLHA
jgi:hypothetical protein